MGTNQAVTAEECGMRMESGACRAALVVAVASGAEPEGRHAWRCLSVEQPLWSLRSRHETACDVNDRPQWAIRGRAWPARSRDSDDICYHSRVENRSGGSSRGAQLLTAPCLHRAHHNSGAACRARCTGADKQAADVCSERSGGPRGQRRSVSVRSSEDRHEALCVSQVAGCMLSARSALEQATDV